MSKILFFLGALLFIVACKDDGFIRVNELTALSKDSDVITVVVKSSSNWLVTTDVNWCNVSPQKGTPNDTLITVSVEENTGSEVRYANISISNKDGENHIVTLKQYGMAVHTMIVYLGMDNNFQSQYNQIMHILKTTWKPAYNNGNLLIFADHGKDAQLMRIHTQDYQTVLDTIKNYGSANSADANVLHQVLEDVIAEYPSKSYGLEVLSHGSGFMSKNTWQNPTSGGFSSQYIIQDVTSRSYMMVSDMAKAIPQMFEYVMFDACFMGGVEVAYEFKDKVKYVLASPCEIMVNTSYKLDYAGEIYGLLYDKMAERLINESPDVISVASDYYEYYKKCSAQAAVSVIDVDALDGLAVYLSEKLKDVDVEEKIDISTIQQFEGNRSYKYYFDLADYYHKIYPDDTVFDDKLAECVLYKANTSAYYSVYGGKTYSIKTFCGLTNYIQQSSYNLMNAEYLNTKWGKRIYGE